MYKICFCGSLIGNKPIHFRKIDVNQCLVNKGLKREVHELFVEESFRSFKFLLQEHCKDRSLPFFKASDSTQEEEEGSLQPLPTLAERYQMIIAPVADCLDESEVVVVPDRVFYKVPFAALMDESGS